jgi:ribosomal protein L11 methyltransferase
MNSVKTIWTAIKFETAPENEDLACWLMIEFGAKGCEVEKLPSANLLVKSYFEGDTEIIDTIALRLEEYGLGKALNSLQHEELDEQDWLGKWKASFKPFAVGNKFVVCPAWEADKPLEAGLEAGLRIIIEPGMAFGTGLHATTQFCLVTVEKGLPKGPILDVGTGSGILAIAAALLDKEAKILAIDNDPTALANAAVNLKLNRVEAQVELLLSSPENVEGKFRTILSNMTCEDIIALLPTYECLLVPNGIVVGAGILKVKMSLLESAIAQANFEISEREEKGEWMGVVLTRA